LLRVTIIPTIICVTLVCRLLLLLTLSLVTCMTRTHTRTDTRVTWRWLRSLWRQQGHVQTYRSTNAHICTCENTAYSSSVVAGSSRNPPCWAKCYFSAWLDSCIRSHGQAHTRRHKTHTYSFNTEWLILQTHKDICTLIRAVS